MAGVTLDTGALIAAGRDDRRFWVWWKWHQRLPGVQSALLDVHERPGLELPTIHLATRAWARAARAGSADDSTAYSSSRQHAFLNPRGWSSERMLVLQAASTSR